LIASCGAEAENYRPSAMTLAARLALECALQLYGLVFRKLRGAFQVLSQRGSRDESEARTESAFGKNRWIEFFIMRKTACAFSSLSLFFYCSINDGVDVTQRAPIFAKLPLRERRDKSFPFSVRRKFFVKSNRGNRGACGALSY